MNHAFSWNQNPRIQNGGRKNLLSGLSCCKEGINVCPCHKLKDMTARSPAFQLLPSRIRYRAQQIGVMQGKASNDSHDCSIETAQNDPSLHKETFFEISVIFYNENNAPPEPSCRDFGACRRRAFIRSLRHNKANAIPENHSETEQRRNKKKKHVAKQSDWQFWKRPKMRMLRKSSRAQRVGKADHKHVAYSKKRLKFFCGRRIKRIGIPCAAQKTDVHLFKKLSGTFKRA